MDKIRLCIGSNDGETVAGSHMGDTKTFFIYDLFENVENMFIEKRDNIARDMEHAKEDKMKTIIGLLKDADVFVARQKSPNFKKIASKTKYQPVVVKAEKISDAITAIGKSFKDIYGYVEKRKNGEIFEAIPELA